MRVHRSLLLTLVACAAACSVRAEVIEGTWVQPGAIELDAAGNPMVAFASPDLRLVRWDGSAWRTEVIDGGCGIVGGLASSGNQLALCFHQERQQLRVAWWDGISWRLDDIDGAFTGSGYCSIEFDGAGRPVVAYMGGAQTDMRAARWTGSSWDVGLVDATPEPPGSRRYPDIAIDAAGQPAIGYQDTALAKLRLARWTGATWSLSDVASVTNFGRFTSCAFDAVGNPAISYHDQTNDELRLARFDGATWQTEAFSSATDFYDMPRSLLFNSAGEPVISYPSPPGDRVATRRAAGWEYLSVSPRVTLVSTDAMGLTPASEPVVVGRLAVAAFDGTAWTEMPFAVNGRPFGGFPSLDVDSVGIPHVAATDLYKRELDAGRRDVGGWSLSNVLVQPSFVYFSSVSMRAGAGGTEAVAFTAGNPGVLSCARFDGTSWTIDIVDAAGGAAASLAYGADGQPAIAYRSSGELRCARYDGTAWSSELVTIVTTSGGQPSLEFDALGRPLIAYYDAGTRVLGLATRDATGWQTQVVDPASPTGEFPDLEIAASGMIGISYYSSSLRKPRLARLRGANITRDTVELGESTTAERRPLLFDRFERPILGFPQWASSIPELAMWDGTRWVVTVVDPSIGLSDGFAIDMTPSGDVMVVYTTRCEGELRGETVVVPPPDILLLRKSVASTAPGWHVPTFPFTQANDDESAPFPASGFPLTVDDPLPGGPLVLYLAVDQAGGSLPPLLRVTKVSGTGMPEVSYR